MAADSTSTVLAELVSSNSTSTLINARGWSDRGIATLTDLVVDASLDITVPIKLSLPGDNLISPTYVDVAFAARCPSGEIELERQGNTVCQACARGEYEKSGSCTLCPTQVECKEASTVYDWKLKVDGWWRTNILSDEMWPCPMERNCKGGTNSSFLGKCRTGSEGPLCGVCAPDFYNAGDECRSCEDSTAKEFFFIIALAVALCVTVAWKIGVARVHRKKTLSQSVLSALTNIVEGQRAKISWQTIQITSSIAWTTSIKWPEPFKSFTELLTNLAELSLIPVDCINQNMNYWHELVIATAVPVGLVALAWLIARLAPNRISSEKKATTFTLFVAFIVLPMVSTKIFRTFICLDFDDETSFLAVDLSISCDEPLYTMMKSYASIAVIIFPVGIPMVFFVVLWSNRKKISTRDLSRPCPVDLRHIAILFEHYNTSAMYWEVVESVRRLLLSSVICFMGQSSSARTTWGALIAIVFAVTCGEVVPCKDPTTQGFAFLTQWLVVVHFLLAVILAAGFGIFSPTMIGWLFMVLTFVVILGAFAHRHKGEDAEANDQPLGVARAAKMITTQPCVMICDPGRTEGCEMALTLLRVMRDLGHVDPKAVIANVWPQQDRSRLLRKRLDSLGLHDVPVGVGSSGGAIASDPAISEKLRTLGEDPAFAGKADRASEIIPGGQLLETTWDEAAPASLVLLITSSLKVR